MVPSWGVISFDRYDIMQISDDKEVDIARPGRNIVRGALGKEHFRGHSLAVGPLHFHNDIDE